MLQGKRITLLCGHYGSGKTNVALNLAYRLSEQEKKVAIADLDIVNPYFRTKDSSNILGEKGIRLICSEYANTNVDIPALPQDMYVITEDKSLDIIIDVGGDDRGALALGRIKQAIIDENNFNMLMVINCFRPLTQTPEDTIEVMAEIEAACGIKFTGLVNNSNLGNDTTANDILKSLNYANEISRITGLPVVLTAFNESLESEVKDKVPNPFPLKLQEKIF
ncbi:MAG: hypothetical protein IJN65_01035 [Clostridia bacterium]|nr:hypothetical protein [Clostridia bacterium]